MREHHMLNNKHQVYKITMWVFALMAVMAAFWELHVLFSDGGYAAAAGVKFFLAEPRMHFYHVQTEAQIQEVRARDRACITDLFNQMSEPERKNCLTELRKLYPLHFWRALKN